MLSSKAEIVYETDWLAAREFALDESPCRTQFDEPGMGIISYPTTEPPKNRRSYTYDNALALLWLTWRGELGSAKKLARTLVCLQKEDGSWGFSFEFAPTRWYHRNYVRSGTVAWAVYALTYYGFESREYWAIDAARRGSDYLVGRTTSPDNPMGGLVTTPYKDSSERPLSLAVTEHQFISHLVLQFFHSSRASRLENTILDKLWLPGEQRFALGMSDSDASDGTAALDYRRALDASGGLGSMWLVANTTYTKAEASLDYALEEFAVESDATTGFVPYRDGVGRYPYNAPAHIFSEGTFGLGLAAARLGEDKLARDIMKLKSEVIAPNAPGLLYSNKDVGQFPADPSAAATLWYLFLKTEVETSRRAPVFRPLSRLFES